MQSFNNKEGAVIIQKLIRVIQEKKDFLSDIDGQIGDGDHGINMNKGFTLCEKKLEGQQYDLSEGLSVLSATLLEDIGGSMGPLYGVLFDEMSMACEGAESVNAEIFLDMLTNGLEGVSSLGNAKRGDKSLLDTLIPAQEAFTLSLENGDSFYDSLTKMNEAAELGWKSTKDMVARIGRASRLGERSRGVLDAGATSCYLILTTIGESIQELLGGNYEG